jgi:hypothetical protein
MMFGPRLRLITEISTVPGAKSLTIDDEVQNLAATPEEFEILYHVNFGRPFLEEGSRFVAPVKRVFPRDARAAEGGMTGWNVYRGPDAGYSEQVYFLELLAGPGGRTEALLHNRAAERGVALAFSTERLPYLTLWKNTAAEENGYVTGIEPATNYPNLRKVERRKGRVPVLPGRGSFRADVTLTVLTTAAEVGAATGRIAGLQAAAVPRIETAQEAETGAKEAEGTRTE